MKLGKKRWTNYGQNFHLPYETEGHVTHDLVFCDDVRQAKMSVKLHGGVRPGHLSAIPVTIDHWKKATMETFDFSTKIPSVLVIMPATNVEQAQLTGEVLTKRAGMPLELKIVHDDKRVGFIASANLAIKDTEHDIVVYTAQDVLPGQDWLKKTVLKMMTENAGLIGFNDGNGTDTLPHLAQCNGHG